MSSATTSSGSRSAAAGSSTSRRRSPSASIRWRTPVEFTVERDDDARPACARRRWWCRSGSTRSGSTCTAPTARAVVETAADEEGRYWAYATLNDAFTRPPALPAGGRDLRARREGRPAQPQGPRLHAVEHRRAQPDRDRGVHRRPGPPDDPRADRHERRVRPVLRVDPVLLPPGLPDGRDGGRRSSTTATAATYEFSRPEEYRIRFAGGQYTEYVFAGPGDAGHPRGLHLADRADRAAAAVVARLPPVPLVRLHPGRGRGARRSATATTASRATRCGSTSSTWTATGSSPGTPSGSPTRPGMLERLAEQGFRVITIIDPGVKHEPGYWVFDQAARARRASAGPRAATSTSARSGRATPRSPTSSPRRRAPGGAS